jgi:hypothetical protein
MHMDSLQGPCPWLLSPSCVHNLCTWIHCKAPVHGFCAHLACIIYAHGFIARLLRTSCAHNLCTWLFETTYEYDISAQLLCIMLLRMASTHRFRAWFLYMYICSCQVTSIALIQPFPIKPHLLKAIQYMISLTDHINTSYLKAHRHGKFFNYQMCGFVTKHG